MQPYVIAGYPDALDSAASRPVSSVATPATGGAGPVTAVPPRPPRPLARWLSTEPVMTPAADRRST